MTAPRVPTDLGVGISGGHNASVRPPGYSPTHGVPPPRTVGHARLRPLVRQLDHPRKPDRRRCRRGLCQGVTRCGHHHLRHGGRLRRRRGRIGAGPGLEGGAPGLHRDLHQGLLPHRAQPQQPGPLPQAHHRVAPRVVGAPPDRSRRPSPGPPVRLRHPAGGDPARLRRSGPPGQGALRRRLGVDGRADRRRRPPGRRDGLRPHHLEPTPVLPAVAGDRVRGGPGLPERGGDPDRLVAAGPGRPDREVPPRCRRRSKDRAPPASRAGR